MKCKQGCTCSTCRIRRQLTDTRSRYQLDKMYRASAEERRQKEVSKKLWDLVSKSASDANFYYEINKKEGRKLG